MCSLKDDDSPSQPAEGVTRSRTLNRPASQAEKSDAMDPRNAPPPSIWQRIFDYLDNWSSQLLTKGKR